MTRDGENQHLLRARSAQGQNTDDVEARNIEENQGIQESQEVRIRFWPVKNRISISTLTLHTSNMYCSFWLKK